MNILTGDETEVGAFSRGLTRGFFYQFTTKTIYVVTNICRDFLTRRVLLASGLWHNTYLDVCRVFTPSAEGRLSCRSTRTSSSLSRKKPPVLPARPFPKAIPP